MPAQLETVLEIAATGSTLLFAALIGLIGLMYLLTAPWQGAGRVAPMRPDASRRPSDGETGDAGFGPQDAAEHARRERAVALAVAVARAESERPAAGDGSSEWRRVHRARLMDRPAARTASRRRR